MGPFYRSGAGRGDSSLSAPKESQRAVSVVPFSPVALLLVKAYGCQLQRVRVAEVLGHESQKHELMEARESFTATTATH